jgi:DMSO/TMAO reductase YedYZ molybdopterin-dependent catalytic subunit
VPQLAHDAWQGKEQSVSKLQDIRTPVFWAEGHPGPLAAGGWQVRLGGLVEEPVTLTYEEILALPKSIADARLTSVSGWSVRGKWGGVRLSDLLALARPKPEASNVQFTSYREIYTTCISLDVALKERTLLAYEFDGEPLDSTYGGPVRIFCPYLWGYKSAKSVVAITLEDRSIPGYWEVRGYPDNAQIKARQLLDVNSQRRRRIPGGEVIEFLD